MCNTYTQTYNEHSIVYHIQLLGEGEGLEDLLKTVHEECKVLERKETQEVLLQLEIWKCLKGTHVHIQIKVKFHFRVHKYPCVIIIFYFFSSCIHSIPYRR